MATRKPRLLRDSEILRAAMQAKQGAEALEREAFQRAADWAIAHVVADEMDAAFLVGTNCEVSIAGPGAPMVSEYCCDEIAAALGMSTDAGRYYVGHALEACCRLPRLWARLVNGEVTVAQVRRITEQTMVLSALAADRADQLLAAYAHSVGRRAIEHAINLAEQQVDPDVAVIRQQLGQDHRRFDVAVDQPSLDGTVDVHGRMDREDAIDLDAALSDLAHQALAFGSEMSLDARRAWAAGQLGREHLDLCGDLDKLDHQKALDHRTESLVEPGSSVVEPVETPAPKHRRETILYVHLSADALGDIGPIATLEATRSPLLLDAVKSWCADSSKVTIRPVLDLAAERHSEASEAYEASPILREQVTVRDRTCVFPHCRRPARRADLDHIQPHAGGGPTSASNLACLCRHHHRSKTHAGWRYRSDPDHPGHHLWTSPTGVHFRRGPTGTVMEIVEPVETPAP